jgi:hypothetical protein
MAEETTHDASDRRREDAGEGQPASIERRRYFRLPRSSLVTHKVMEFSVDPSAPEAGRIRDLSVSGVRFESETKYVPGNLLKLELDLPGWEREKIDFFRSDPGEALKPLVVLAEVRWVKPVSDRYEVGAHFVNIDEWHGKALLKYLEKLREENP